MERAQKSLQIERIAMPVRDDAKAGSRSARRPMQSSARTTADDETQPREVAPHLLSDYAYSGDAGVMAAFTRSKIGSGVVGRVRSRRRARSSGTFPVCAWDAGDIAAACLVAWAVG